MSTDPKQVISKAFNNQPNFMSPNPIAYSMAGTKEPLCVELSWGYGIFSDKVYGVTVFKPDGQRTEYDQSFTNLEDAEEYIGNLP